MTSFALSDDQVALREAARVFGHKVLLAAAMKCEALDEEVPLHIIRQMSGLGFVGLNIPAEYGGQGFDTLTCGVLMEELSGAWFAASSFATIMSAGPILHAGTEAQKSRFLPPLACGEAIAAFALTEPHTGSDAASITTRASRDGDDYVIHGTKIYITNAARADMIIVFARTNADADRGKGISVFIVPKGTKGLSIGQRFRTLGHGANPIAEVVFDNCRIPGSNRLGEEGEAFSYIARDFAKTRAIYALRAVGVAQYAMDYALAYALERKAFGQPIASFQGIRFKVADIITKIEAARQLAYRACVLAEMDTSEAPAAASMAKHCAADTAVEATSEAIQIMGGAGYTCDHPLERYYREAKLFQIGDGTSEVLRLLISRYATKRAQGGMPARLP